MHREKVFIGKQALGISHWEKDKIQGAGCKV